MKIFAFILTAYVFALFVMPCIHMAHEHVNHVQFAETAAENNSSDIDHCSPFCTCNCCSSPVVKNKTIISADRNSVAEPFVDLYSNGKLPKRFHTFWQPPKIG